MLLRSILLLAIVFAFGRSSPVNSTAHSNLLIEAETGGHSKLTPEEDDDEIKFLEEWTGVDLSTKDKSGSDQGSINAERTPNRPSLGEFGMETLESISANGWNTNPNADQVTYDEVELEALKKEDALLDKELQKTELEIDLLKKELKHLESTTEHHELVTGDHQRQTTARLQVLHPAEPEMTSLIDTNTAMPVGLHSAKNNTTIQKPVPADFLKAGVAHIDCTLGIMLISLVVTFLSFRL